MILAVDPGITTGYCLLSDVGVLSDWGEVDTAALPQKIEELDILCVYTLVAIEDIPTVGLSPLGRRLQSVVQQLYERWPEAMRIPPGVWKTSSVVRTIVAPPTISRHARDAFYIAHYARRKSGLFV